MGIAGACSPALDSIHSRRVQWRSDSLHGPGDVPAGYEIPVVAWVVDGDGHAIRANGLLAASGHPSIQLRRGIGSGFLAATNSIGLLDYTPSVGAIATNKPIHIEAATAWTTVSGVLGNTTWPQDSRIHVTGNLTVPAGVTLTIEHSTIVRINSGINITNNGTVQVNGFLDFPVVFMPAVKGQPWGGFVSKNANEVSAAE